MPCAFSPAPLSILTSLPIHDKYPRQSEAKQPLTHQTYPMIEKKLYDDYLFRSYLVYANTFGSDMKEKGIQFALKSLNDKSPFNTFENKTVPSVKL